MQAVASALGFAWSATEVEPALNQVESAACFFYSFYSSSPDKLTFLLIRSCPMLLKIWFDRGCNLCKEVQGGSAVKLCWLPFPHSIHSDLILGWLLPLLSFNCICSSIYSRKILINWNLKMIISRNNQHLSNDHLQKESRSKVSGAWLISHTEVTTCVLRP